MSQVNKDDMDIETLLGAIRRNTGEQAGPEVKYVPKKKKKQPGLTLEDGEQAFSALFFPPMEVSDFPVKVYKDTDWPLEVRDKIPILDKNYHFPPIIEKLMFALHMNAGPVLLKGPTGTGKTSLIRQVCALTNQPFMRVGCHKQQEYSEFLGTNRVVSNGGTPVTEHSHTDTTLAATYGTVLCIDEAFRSPTLMAIQPLLEYPNPTLTLQDAHGRGKMIIPPSTFRILMTDNTSGLGDDSGTYQSETQDLSVLDRITTAINVEYMSPDVELKTLLKAVPTIESELAKTLIKVAGLVRDAFVKGTINQTMSIRALMTWARYTGYMGLQPSFEYTFVSKLDNSVAPYAMECFAQVIPTSSPFEQV